IHRVSLRLRPLDGVRIRDRQRKLTSGEHLSALRGAPPYGWILRGQRFQILQRRLSAPRLFQTNQQLVVFVVNRNLAALPLGLEQIFVGFRGVFFLLLLGVETETRGQRVRSSPIAVAIF